MSEQVERELVTEASVQEVWDAVTSDGWLADDVRLDLRAAGDASFRTGEVEKTGWVEDVSPPAGGADQPASLTFWWAADGEPATRVQLTITPGQDGTCVRVVESRPLEALDLIGMPLPGGEGRSFGPALLAA